jgi:hypothetical protein
MSPSRTYFLRRAVALFALAAAPALGCERKGDYVVSDDPAACEALVRGVDVGFAPAAGGACSGSFTPPGAAEPVALRECTAPCLDAGAADADARCVVLFTPPADPEEDCVCVRRGGAFACGGDGARLDR